jgi:hypothetical protein
MRFGAVAVPLLLLVSIAVLVPNHPAGRDPQEDTGVFFYAAQRLLDGGLPYRDIWDHKPPGVYFVDAFGLAFGGRVGVWLIQIAFLAAAALAGYRALRREFGDVPALIGSLAWLVASPRLFLERGHTNFVEFFALPLQLGALLLYVRPLTTSRALTIGVLGGAAVLFKPTLVGIWIAIGLVTLVQRRRQAVGTVAALALGAVVPLALVAAWAFSRGILAEMLDQTLVYNRAYASFLPVENRLRDLVGGLRLTLDSGLVLITFTAWLYAAITRRWRSPLVLVAFVAFPLELVLSTFGRGYHYYFLAWLPSMAVLTAFAVSELQRLAPPRLARVALALGTIAMCVQPAFLVTSLALTTDRGRFSGAAAYIAANSGPADTILIWGAHSEVLFLADRLSPTQFVYQYAPLYTRGYTNPERVAELLADLERARPLLILDASLESPVTPPLDAAAFRTWTSPDIQYEPLPVMERVIDFVERNYERAGVEPATGWPLWRLRTAATP